MNDPRHPVTPSRPMPQPAKPTGLMDPLVATSHEVGRPSSHRPPSDKVSIDDDSIELVDDQDEIPAGGQALPKMSDSLAAKRIVTIGADNAKLKEDWKRQTVRTGTGTGACRVKSFHGKYSEEGMRYLDHSINTWLDIHPEVEIKFVTSTVNLSEGKIREPALVLNVWY